MKSMLRAVFATVLLAGAAMAPALAQEAVGTLHVNTSPVMVSTGGGDFVSVTADTPLHVGDRITIADNGEATLTYNNGYVLHYEAPGVYTVQVAPAVTTSLGASGASTAATVGVVLGAAALGAAAVDQIGNVVPPVDPATSR